MNLYTKNCMLFFGVLLIASSCQTSLRSTYEFECAVQLSEAEIREKQLNNFKDYSDTDLAKLADITSFIIEQNGDTSEFEVFYNQRTLNSLVLDIYGLENERQIDQTVCRLFEEKNLDLPQQTTLLFHRYINGTEDGGIIVGLKRKQ